MNYQLINKFRHFANTPLKHKCEMINQWMDRERSSTRACAMPNSQILLQIPKEEYYLSYAFFCEYKAGCCEMAFFTERLTKGDVFIDVGSFCGAYSFAAHACLEGHVEVLALEAFAKNVKRIERVALTNPSMPVTIMEAMVGDGTPALTSVNTEDIIICRGDKFSVNTKDSDKQSVTKTLTELAAEWKHDPTVIKIDVEGFELQVLAGAADLLTKTRPRLWIEVHPGYLRRQGRQAEEVSLFLKKLGYRITEFDDISYPTQDISFHLYAE